MFVTAASDTCCVTVSALVCVPGRLDSDAF